MSEGCTKQDRISESQQDFRSLPEPAYALADRGHTSKKTPPLFNAGLCGAKLRGHPGSHEASGAATGAPGAFGSFCSDPAMATTSSSHWQAQASNAGEDDACSRAGPWRDWLELCRFRY